MPNNIEKFRISRSMQQRELDEGLVEYEEIRKEATEEMNKKADEIIDSFYAEGLERGKKNPEYALSERLNTFSKAQKYAIFSRWLERDPEEALWRLDEFEYLPSGLQKEIASYLLSHESHEGWVCVYVLEVFDKITDRTLHNILFKKGRLSFSTLAENKEKFPYATDEQILEKARHADPFYRNSYWYDWATIIPYVDKFPSISKQQAIEGVFKQNTNSRPGVLIEHREKLGVSMRDLIDKFCQYKMSYELCRNLKFIDPEYHQEIADKVIQEKTAGAILQNAEDFQQINISNILKNIAKIGQVKLTGNRRLDGLGLILDNFYRLPATWITGMPQELIDAILKRYPTKIAYRVDEFGDKIDRRDLTNLLFEQKEFDALFDMAKKLGQEKNETLVMRIIEAGGAKYIIQQIENQFSPRMSRAVYRRLMKEYPQETIRHIMHFDGITKEDVYHAVVTYDLDRYSNFAKIIEDPTKIEGLQLNQEFAEKLLEGGHVYILLDGLEKFEGIDLVELAEYISDENHNFEGLLRYVNKFPKTVHAWVANRAIELGYGEEFIQCYHLFQGLDDVNMVQKLIQRKGDLSLLIVQNIDSFKGIKNDRNIGEHLWNEYVKFHWDIHNMLQLHNMYTPPIDQAFVFAYDLLSDQLTPATYETVKKVKEGSLSKEEMRTLGVTKTGETGINQLRQKVSRVKSEILQSEFDATILESSPFYQQYYKSYVRYVESEWGKHDESTFNDTVVAYNNLKTEGKLRELPEAYEESGELRVAKIDRKKQEAFQYSDQFLSRYGTLQSSLSVAIKLLGEKTPLSQLVTKAEAKRADIVQVLKEKLEQLQHPKAIENIQKRITALESIDLRSVKNFQNNFEILSQFGEFHEELRQLSFYYALKKNKTYRESAKGIARREKPEFDDVSWMINFIDHIVNEETWAKYFTDNKATKAFSKLVNANALKEEFSRAQNQASAGTISMEFVPTRGLLMEFSGHIADACWASKYKSIAESYPNFSTVVMVQNRGTKHERLVGACMLIETQDKQGAPLLVIRGLNPIENVINAVAVEDFLEKFTNYARGVAKKMKRQLAIVIDNHSGGSATNRPVLFQLLTEKKETMHPVQLMSHQDTEFNGYNITNVTFVFE